jgi:predicted lactoylglutathione lyase
MEQRLSLLTLGVWNLDRSVRFYEALGWTRSGPTEGVAFFQLGGVVLSLYPRENLANDMGVAPHGEGFAGITIAHNVREKSEVDDAVDAFVAAGGTVVRAPFTIEWGGYIAFAADPDGYVWEIAWNPGFPIAADGSITIRS